MEEIVNIDGRLFRLTIDRPLTASEKAQTITDIRSSVTTNRLYPAYMAPTDIYVVPNDCLEPCDVYVAVTWLNYGDVAGQLTPGIILDGFLTTFPPETLNGGDSISLAFDILGLASGTHTIQPSPNGDTYIQTVNVYPPYSK